MGSERFDRGLFSQAAEVFMRNRRCQMVAAGLAPGGGNSAGDAASRRPEVGGHHLVSAISLRKMGFTESSRLIGQDLVRQVDRNLIGGGPADAGGIFVGDVQTRAVDLEQKVSEM